MLSLLVLACIASKDERDITSKFGVSTPALLYKVYPHAFHNFGVGICLVYDSLLGLLVFGCVARCNG